MSTTLPNIIKSHVCFYASFDQGINADISRGDSRATYQPSVVKHDSTAGRCGGGLVFSAAKHGWTEDECMFSAKDNFPYSKHTFSGTISLWLNGDPNADLDPQVPVDPFHISRQAADGSFYLDLTKPNDARYGSPRKMRFGIYNDSPANDKFIGGQLIVIGELNWQRGEWHHVVATWQNANSGNEDGQAEVYIDGVRRGWMSHYQHQVTWDIDDMTIGLGQRYSGIIDDVLILDTALSSEQINALYQHPVGDLL